MNLRATLIGSALALGLSTTAGAETSAETEATTSDANTPLTVEFIGDPRKYTDASLDNSRSEKAFARVQDGLRTHLQSLGDKALTDGRTLKIEILDIDLAGHIEPTRSTAQDLRVLREVTWPRIKLRYTLEAPGAAPVTATETISDMNYLSSASMLPRNETLRYEKKLLSDWFQARIVEGRPGPAANSKSG